VEREDENAIVEDQFGRFNARSFSGTNEEIYFYGRWVVERKLYHNEADM
jgi:hypothetical protein